MTVAVFDASVLVPLFVATETSAVAERCASSFDVVSLNHAPVEAANAFARQAYAGNITPEDAALSYRQLMTLTRWLPTEPFVDKALELAIEANHGVYDCLYVACAMARQVPLVTADKTMTRKFTGVVPAGIVNLYDMPSELP